MYRCKECGSEYEEKPDYCDCGNDEFEEIVPEVPQKENKINIEPQINCEQQKENLSSKQNSAGSVNSFVQEDSVNIKPKPTAAKSYSKPLNSPQTVQPKTFEEQYPGLSRFFSSIDPISAIIFAACLFLAVYILFFAWNITDNSMSVANKTETSVSKNIPSIEKIWDNTPPKPVVKKETTTKITTNETNTTVQNKTVTPPKPVITTNNVSSTPKTVSKPTVSNKVSDIKKTQNAVNKKQTQTKPQTNNVKTNTVNYQAEQQAKIQAQKAAAEAARKKAEQEATQKKLAEEKAKKAAEAKAKQEALKKAQQAEAAKKELSAYKANLRNTIGRKIDFTKVSGNGSCTVAFRVDSNGKLVNRSFAKQSSNDSLNDAVYAAVMSTPIFNPPPSGYRNEILNLNIRFSNGNYEITLP